MSLNPEQVVANNNTPIAVLNLSGNSTTVSPGIPITFDGTQSYDPDNTNIIAYNWWYVDGVAKSQGSTADKKIFSYNFTLPEGVNSKTYQIKLTVRDNEYITASKTITVTVTVTLSGRTEYYLTDHLGSIRTTIDQNGTVIGFDDYDPFGNVLPGRSSNLGTPNDLNKFTGHERDQEGGLDLDYMLARNYDSELGRFYSVDPLASKFPAWSPYNYTMNNPIYYKDPDGEFVISFLTGFFRSLYNSNSLGTSVKSGWSSVKNEASIWSSFFRGSTKQVAWKLSWELPQHLIGVSVGIVNNWLGNIKSISHSEGASLIELNESSFGAYTLGGIIHAQNGTKVGSPLYKHEYGHYLQSQFYGPSYLFRIAIPSFVSAIIYKYDLIPNYNHTLFETEVDANSRMKEYNYNKKNKIPQSKPWNNFKDSILINPSNYFK